MNKYSTGMKVDKESQKPINAPMTTKPLEILRDVMLLETPLGPPTHLLSLLILRMPLRLPTQPGPTGQRNPKKKRIMPTERSAKFR